MTKQASDGWVFCGGQYPRHEKRIGFYTIIASDDGKWVVHDDGEDALFSVVISKSLEEAKVKSEAFLRSYCEANGRIFAPVLSWLLEEDDRGEGQTKRRQWTASVFGWKARVYAVCFSPNGTEFFRWVASRKDFEGGSFFSHRADDVDGFASPEEAKSSLEKTLRGMGILFKTEDEAIFEARNSRGFSKKEAMNRLGGAGTIQRDKR